MAVRVYKVPLNKVVEPDIKREYSITLAIQGQIITRWGVEAIERAKKRLCENCKLAGSCRLLPTCFDGTYCPYFSVRGNDR